MNLDGHPAFLVPAHPLVSVVIPVYNGLPLTDRCLRWLDAQTPHDLIEVIVVDDCSTDGTSDYLARCAGVKVIRNEVNSGFLASVNRGAAAGTGEFIFFLNNDTAVQPGWLTALLDAMSSSADVAAVGSRLVYPDGTLQEAGGVIWADARGWNYGRGESASEPEYGFRREVDYCSAAALMVRRDRFEELGGFDPRFAPGYYEDTDLCFTLRSRGHKVLYEPRSVVTHDEGATFGTDVLATPMNGHGKLSQFINRYQFAAKWATELHHHWPYGTANGLLGGRIDPRPRILIVDHLVPTPDRDSGSLRMHSIGELFRQLECHVTLFPWNRAASQPYTSDLQRLGIEVHYGSLTFAEFCAQRSHVYDVVILSRPSFAALAIGDVERHFPEALTLYDTVDLHFLREQRRLELEGRPADPALVAERAVELGLIARCDLTVTVTEDEARMVEDEVPGARTIVLPNVHAPVDGDIPGPASRRDLLFIGGFLHPPNVDAMVWFVGEVLPAIRREVDVSLWILGSEPPPEVKRLASEHVRVTGYIPDVTPHFHNARIFVAPLRYGAGMKGKLGQAMTLGLPVVTTSIGSEGMRMSDGVHMMVRDGAEAFAQAVIDLYTDDALWQRLSQAARTTVCTLFGPDAMRARLEALLRGVPTTAGR